MSMISRGKGRRSPHPAYPVHPCLMPRSVARGMTMIEILVALGILAVAIGSILTIFHAGARHGARAREKMEAGRVALAVFDLVDKGFSVNSAKFGRGKTTAGKIEDGEIVKSEELAHLDDAPVTYTKWYNEWGPTYVAPSPVPLVWKYETRAYAADGVGMHQLTVTVAVDEDGDYIFDDAPPEPDRVVRVYEAILADRRVTP